MRLRNLWSALDSRSKLKDQQLPCFPYLPWSKLKDHPKQILKNSVHSVRRRRPPPPVETGGEGADIQFNFSPLLWQWKAPVKGVDLFTDFMKFVVVVVVL